MAREIKSPGRDAGGIPLPATEAYRLIMRVQQRRSPIMTRATRLTYYNGREMSPAELSRLLKRFELKDEAAGRFLGVKRLAIWRWRHGEAEVSPQAAMVLRIMEALNIMPDEVEQIMRTFPADYPREFPDHS